MVQKINYYFDDFRVYADSCPARPETVARPDNALWIAPPDDCPEGHVIVAKADGSGWETVPDYREAGAFDPEGQWRRVTEPGPLPDGWTAERPPPSAEALRETRINAIKSELISLDIASVRADRVINLGVDTPEDHQKLAEIEARAVILRAELAELEAA